MKAWLVQYRPGDHVEKYLDKKGLQNTAPIKIVTLKGQYQKGDIVYFWRAGNERGLIGWGTVVSGEVYKTLHTDDTKSDRMDVSIKTLITPLIPVNEIAEMDAMAEHAIIKFPKAVNYRISIAQAHELNKLLNQHKAEPLPNLGGLEENLPKQSKSKSDGVKISRTYPKGEIKSIHPDFTQQNQKEADSLSTLGDCLDEFKIKPTSQIMQFFDLCGRVAKLRRASSERGILTDEVLLFTWIEMSRHSQYSVITNFAPPYLEILIEKVFSGIRKSSAYEGDLLGTFLARPDFTSPGADTTQILNIKVSDGFRRILNIANKLRGKWGGGSYLAQPFLAACIIPQWNDIRQSPNYRKLIEQFGLTNKVFLSNFIKDAVEAGANSQQIQGWREVFPLLYRSPDTPKGGFAPSNAGNDADTADKDTTDFNDVEPEAEMLARYISLRNLNTPQSIALFGDWGSGKSFLLNKTQAAVKAIANNAAPVHEAKEDCAYCNGIVQIEFNAWHYIESNLWASLTTHIFDRLNAWLNDQVENKDDIDKWFQQLDTAGEEVLRAKNEKENAIYSQAHVQNELIDARTTLKIKQNELQEHTPADLWQAVKDTIAGDKDFSKDIQNAGRELGLDALHQSAEDLQTVLQDAKTLGGRGQLAFTALKSHGGLYFIAGLSLLVIPGLVALGIHKLDLNLFSEGVGAMGAIMATLTAWLGLGMKHARTALSKLDKFESNLNKIINDETKEYQKKVSDAQTAVDDASSDVELAEERLSDSNKTVDALRLSLQESTPQARLNAFIRNQVANKEYTQYLGLVSTIRRDFEKLSKLMAPSKKEDEDAARVDKEIGPLSGDKKPFERIILYIDDLDRCPPEKVVEVLQAIHLLLAFPLFVVVVAVDARWVARALRDHYPTLLVENVAYDLEHMAPRQDDQDGNENINGNDKPSTDHEASSHDYLEKIFQIPYWVKPMDADSSKKFIEQLVTVEQEELSKTVDQKPGLAPITAPDTSNNLDTPETLNELRADDNEPEENDPEEPDVEEPATDTSPSFNASPNMVKITKNESDYMQAMAPFIGNSPRRLKRFANLYQLIKSGLSEEHAETFVGEDGESINYRAVLTNLAIVTGAPNFAPIYFEKLTEEHQKINKPTGAFLADLMLLFNPYEQAKANQESIRIGKALEHLINLDKHTDDECIKALHNWSRSVSRFSFTTRPK